MEFTLVLALISLSVLPAHAQQSERSPEDLILDAIRNSSSSNAQTSGEAKAAADKRLLEIMLMDSQPVYLEVSDGIATATQGNHSVNLSAIPGTFEYLQRISKHNRAACDQVITVTRMVSGRLVLEQGSPDAPKFMTRNFPRMCVLEDNVRFVPGVPQYLLVYAESESAYAGFQPIQQTTSSPVSGSGTVTNAYGNKWNFNYSGTLTETRRAEAPYVVRSRSLYLYAYSEDSRIVSHRSIATSAQTGGDAAYGAGYNTGQLLSRLWSNPKQLAKNVLRDVQKDSMKYGKK